jgi:ketosteroid isomerase-like protein
MMKLILFSFFILFINPEHSTIHNPEISTQQNSNRINDLDSYWAELSRTVREGDFQGYAKTYHDDAVVVFAVGNNKTSVAIADALSG